MDSKEKQYHQLVNTYAHRTVFQSSPIDYMINELRIFSYNGRSIDLIYDSIPNESD